MKKVFRFIGILLLVLVLIFVILGLVGPKDVTVEKSIVINGSRDAVWEQVANFKNGPNWDPWYETDSTATRTYFGTDGQAGSGYSWEGKKMGVGNMKDTAITGDKVNYALHFDKPFKADASGFYQVSDAGNGQVKVTWNYYQKFNFMMSAMQPIMSMDKMLGGQFDKGLNKLKKYVESGKAGGSGNAGGMVEETQFPGRNYAGVRKLVAVADIKKFFNENAKKLSSEIGGINGPMAGLYYSWDTVKHNTDMAIVFPIADSIKSVKGASVFHINPSKADMYTLKGGYSGMMNAHKVIGKYMAEKGHKMGMVVEEYTVGQAQEPDSNKWVTKIYYLTQ